MDINSIVAGLQAQPFHLYDDLAARSHTAPPAAHGLYAWWQSAGALPGVPGTPHPDDPSVELLYVGTNRSPVVVAESLAQVALGREAVRGGIAA